MKLWKRSLALLLVLVVLVLSSCQPTGAGTQEDRLRLLTAISYEDMEYTRPDLAQIRQMVDEGCNLAQTAETVTQLVEYISEYYLLYYDFMTNYSLATIRYYGNTGDSYWEAEYNFCLEGAASLEVDLEELMRALAQSAFRDALEAPEYFGPDFFAAYDDENIWDDTMLALMEQQAQLEGEYMSVSSEAASAGSTDAMFTQYGPQLEEIYIQLIRVRKQMAAHAGYASYADFAYDNFYDRSYTPAQAQVYLLEIQSMKQLGTDVLYVSDFSSLGAACSSTNALDYINTAATNMGGRILAAYRFLEKTRTYDIAYRENKYDVSFQTDLYNYNSPFLFMCPTGTQLDKLTIAHEFGHYVGSYIGYGSYMGLDVAEVQSQTMEYLSLIYADAGQTMTRYKMVDSLYVYLQQALFASFEYQVYELEESQLTASNLQIIFRQSCQAYGLGDIAETGMEYTMIPHLYIEPLYLVSYVVSNDVALQIYQKELESSGAGLALYNLCLERCDQYLPDMMQACGLQDPMAQGRIAQVKAFFEELIRKYQ